MDSARRAVLGGPPRVFPGPMSYSSKLFSLAKQYIPGGVNSPVRAFRNVGGEPFFVKRAKGCRILDVDDRWLIDYVGTWGPAILGHAPDVLVRTVQEVAKSGLSFGIPNPWEVEMARLIVEWVPSVANFMLVKVGDGARVFGALQARGVIVRPVKVYGLPEWVRVTVGTPKQNERLLAELATAL